VEKLIGKRADTPRADLSWKNLKFPVAWRSAIMRAMERASERQWASRSGPFGAGVMTRQTGASAAPPIGATPTKV
jgi:hypothetical protein